MRRSCQDIRRSSASVSWILVAACSLLVLLCAVPAPALAQDDAESGQSQVRFVHVSPGIGTVDVYVDGALFLVGINFGAISDPIRFETGDHAVTVVPSGGARDDALLDTTVTLPPASNVDLSLLGPAEEPGLAAHPIDLSPLPPNTARFNVVLGSRDVGPIDIELTGGDPIFPTVDYLGATEYADVTAGTYDLEASYAGVTTIVLEMPGVVLDAGVVYTLYVVGEAAAGELQSIVSGWEADPVLLEGHPATIRTGTCQDGTGGDVVADLTIVSVSPFEIPVGAEGAAGTESSFTAVGITFEDMTGSAHIIAVGSAEDQPDQIVACGELGGTPADDGSLVVGLRQQASSGIVGMAVLAPNVIDPNVTDVSLFVSNDLVDQSREADSATAPPVDETAPAIVVAPEAGIPAATPEAGE